MNPKTAEKNKRWRLIAHTGIQGGLILRMLIYWVIFEGIGTGSVILLTFFSNGPLTASGCLLVSTVATFLVLPVLVLDLVEFSNRFTGPIHRLKERLTALSEGKRGHELRLREKDFYTDLEIPFNLLRTNVLELRKKRKSKKRQEDRQPDLDLDSTFPEVHIDAPNPST